jgi:molybdopterin molybdotransferase
MISVSEALIVVGQHKPELGAETVHINAAGGRTIADDTYARIDMPPFKGSSMDGYAVNACDIGESLSVIGESSAGRPSEQTVKLGEAVKVSTGAVVPEGTDRILLKEDAGLLGRLLRVQKSPRPNAFIRHVGSDFHTGELLAQKGQMLTPALVTLCAAANHANLKVQRQLKIALISSGNELRVPGSDLSKGEIIAANVIGLKATLEMWGANVTNMGIVRDEQTSIRTMLKSLTGFDIIITIGGASVGDHDLIPPECKAAGYTCLFESVAIRPGKPCWMMQKNTQIIFGLPGNPASALVCAHIFLRPLLGLTNNFTTIALAEGIEENGPRETYLRAKAFNEDGLLKATPYPTQDSYRLRPQAHANCLLRIPAMGGPYKAGQIVEALPFDNEGFLL